MTSASWKKQAFCGWWVGQQEAVGKACCGLGGDRPAIMDCILLQLALVWAEPVCAPVCSSVKWEL